MRRVLLAGGGLQAISAARSLADAGYEPGLWAPASDYAHRSSALGFSRGASFSSDVSGLVAYIRDNGVEAVLPMSDRYASLLSVNKKRILEEGACVACVPDPECLETAADKRRLMALCEAHGLPHPRTLGDDRLSGSDMALLRFPVLVKPDHSVGARGIEKVSDPSLLARTVARVREIYGPCHVQEYISGGRPYFNVMVYRDASGACLGSAVLEIIRYYPLQGGSSSMCRSVENARLVELCMKTLGIIGYEGFADFDILQTEGGDWRIIEINPRVPASLRGAYVSGVNFPAVIVADALGLPQLEHEYCPGKTLRYLGLDLMWFISSPRRFGSDPSWFRFWGRDIYYQEGGCADWRAMLASLASNFNKIEFKGGRIRKKTH